MELIRNRFKAAVKEGRPQIGLWNSIAGTAVTDIIAGGGFDWVLIDTEHAVIEPGEVQVALQILNGYPEVAALVRPLSNDAPLIKRHLDMGAQTLLVPFVQTGAEAEAAALACAYPPAGIRGVAGMTRASRYGRITDYARRANEEICLLVQVETASALDHLDEIALTPGVDGVFIGPSDLAASLGHPGNPGHAEVQEAIDHTLDRLKTLGVPSGILALDPEKARAYLERGVGFVAVGLDLLMVAQAVDRLRSAFPR
ncbi:HpcH/HpaI aldolase family protein [Oceanomicrobium pacificus]|uniref:Hydroxypyruvate/pyruvate aldolase n=1 Tax=Oceanomicrobium pacificus TaxID=2692916 RepID=A0A6B0TSD8_9RHOB|nr:aldolase/citrate lyase family protein [Oceanomicrobium pacificus]MXU63923.1 4-hydroxy-2-oxo-heptane-1,7-dioate aldolase [Oceanomicrobium pacificus]